MNLYKNIPTWEITIWLEEQLEKIINRSMYETRWDDVDLYIDIDECELIDFIEINRIIHKLINTNTGHGITLGQVSASLRRAHNGGFFPKITIRLRIW